MTEATEIAIAVVERDGCYLVGQRPAGVPLAGYWEFPGGKREAGESAAEAARRECREETGLEIEILDEYPSRRQTYEHGELWLRFFRARPLDPPEQPAPPYRWVEREQLATMTFPAGNQPLLKQLTSPHS